MKGQTLKRPYTATDDRGKSMKAITPVQVKLIHSLKSALSLSDELYRDILMERFKVKSSKSLDTVNASKLIDELQRKAVKAGVWQDRGPDMNRQPGNPVNTSSGKRYTDMDNRPGMASGGQLRKIEFMWSQLSYTDEPQARIKALRTFLLRVAKVSDMRFLTREDGVKVINALVSMQERKKGGEL